MKKQWWQIRKRFRVSFKKMILWLRHFTYPVTAERLKKAKYADLPAPLALEKITKGRDLIVEIGSGHGEVLLSNDATKSISVGYETKTRFFKLTARKVKKRADIFAFQGDAYESTLLHYVDNSISRLLILFPDPWHKRKHNKRRPITAQYLNAVAQKIKKGGLVLVATDWPDYAEFIEEQVKMVAENYHVVVKPYDPVDYGLPVTHFHQKWIRKGRKFTAFELIKK